MSDHMYEDKVKWQVSRGNYDAMPTISPPSGWRLDPSQDGVWFPFAYVSGDAIWRRKLVKVD